MLGWLAVISASPVTLSRYLTPALPARAILQGAGRLAREGDQDHLWLQRVTNATHARLRVLGLPDA